MAAATSESGSATAKASNTSVGPSEYCEIDSRAVEALFVFVVFGLVCRAALEALPNGDGLREYRQ